MNRFLRALAYVAPGMAMARAHALTVIRDYDGAKSGRRQSSLTGRATSANTEISKALGPLRDRSRDLARNTAIGARVLDVLVAHIVGHGVNPRWDTGAAQLDRRLAALWSEWTRRCDITGELDFHGLVALAVRSMLEGGDCLVRMVDRRFGDDAVPLRLQLLEGDHLDETVAQFNRTAPRVRMGVELGEWGERVAYHVHQDHPGEYDVFGRLSSVRLDRRDVCHLYRPLRAGQLRGVPVFAPVLMAARDHADLIDAIVVKARMEAVHGLVLKRPDSAPQSIASAAKGQDGELHASYRPGTIIDLPPGYDVTTLAPSGSAGLGEISIQTLMAVAAGTGVTYDQVTGDLRQSNYSSLRAGKIEFRRLVEQIQWLALVPMVLDRIADRFVETAILAGQLRPRSGGYGRTWVMPATEPVDPRKDLEADILAVRAGRMSPQDFIGAWGRDWREVLRETASFNAEADALGLVLQIDARKVSGAGQTQTAPASIDSTADPATNPAADLPPESVEAP